MIIGLIKEGKIPSDTRVALTPIQCKYLMDLHGIKFIVQPSASRCYTDAEYAEQGCLMSDELDTCDYLLGIKEVPIKQLIANKTYFFFSHTIKKQAFNRKLLQAALDKKIRLIDWETLTNEKGERLIAFGRWAGIVGAHNGIMTLGKRCKSFKLSQMVKFKDFAAAQITYQTLQLPAVKIVLTGTGRVANGAAEVLDAMRIERVSAADFLTKTYTKAVYTQLGSADYVRRIDGKPYDRASFHATPDQYENAFLPYTAVADVMMNGIFWKKDSPAFFTTDDMKKPAFKIRTIADITCDIAPEASVPSTLDASTIADPIFGYDIDKQCITKPFKHNVVDVMSIDNLPNELPRDASEAFGNQFINNVLFDMQMDNIEVIDRATIVNNGVLQPLYEYLTDYVYDKV